MKIVLAGIGVISPIGNNRGDFWSALSNGASGVKSCNRFAPVTEMCAEVKNLNFNKFFDARRFRRVSSVSKYALVATGEAMADAGMDVGESFINAGAVVGITHGALDYSCEFHEGLIQDGPLGASPALFSDSVLNTVTGSLSLAFGIKGPAHTLMGGSPVGLKALALGADMLKAGRVDCSVVCSSEMLNQRSVEAYDKFGLVAKRANGSQGQGFYPDATIGFVPAEGASSVIMRPLSYAQQHGDKALAEVAGYGFAVGPVEQRIKRSITGALDMAALKAGEIDCVFSGANGGVNDSAEGEALGGILSEGTPAVCIKKNIGESFGAASLMSVAAGAISLKEQVIPFFMDGVVDSKVWAWAGKPSLSTIVDMKNILVVSNGLAGDAGCIILKRL